MAYPSMQTRPRSPWDERLPDGRSIDEVVATMLGGGMPTSVGQAPLDARVPRLPPTALDQPIATQPGPGPATIAPGSVHVGTAAPSTLNTLGRKLAEYRTLQDADIGNKVKRTDWGYEEMPPPAGGPSRLKEALRGLVLGAAIGSQGPTEGAALRALGGAATGAAAGGISPRLLQAFTRDQELNRVRGDIETEQQMGLRNAQIAETLAQAEQRRNQPELEMLKLERLMREDEDQRADRTTRSQQAAEANRLRQKEFEERQRHNKVVESKPPTKRAPRTLNGQFWEEDANGVMRVKPGSPPAAPSAAESRQNEQSADRSAKARQAASLYSKGSEYWDQAKSKRAEAEALPRGVPNRDERYRALVREAEGLEAKTREVQIKGDLLAAEAEATPAYSAAPGKAFNLRAWIADHPNATPAEVAAKRAQYQGKYRIIE